MEDVRLLAAQTILDRGVRFRLPAPFWKRWLKRDWIIIRNLKAGTILEIARVVVDEKLEDVAGLSDYEFLYKSIPACARCIALAALNDKAKIARSSDKLTEMLLHYVSNESLIQLFMQIKVMSRVADFMNITRYLLTITQTMMNPKNLGRDDGS